MDWRSASHGAEAPATRPASVSAAQLGLSVLVLFASFAGAWGGVRARLAHVERIANKAHERMDEHLQFHLEKS